MPIFEFTHLKIQSRNIDDRSPVMSLVKDISAKLIGDKGYISKKLSAELFEQNVTLITKIKKKMKNCLMDMSVLR